MRYAKYVLICLCVVLSLLLTTELYKSYSADFDGYDHFIMRDISEGTLDDQLERIAYMLDQNELEYFLVNKIIEDSSRVTIELYCSSDEVRDRLQKEDRRAEGIYNSLFYGSVTISYGENFAAFAEAAYTSETAYVCMIDAIDDVTRLPYRSEYFSENLIKGQVSISYLLLICFMWFLTALCVLLLSMVDSYIYPKTLFIQLTYGYPKKELIIKRLCEEAVGLTLAFFIPILLLHSFLILYIMPVTWWVMVFIMLAVNSVILLHPFWKFNCRAALGRGQHANRVLTACYGIRVVLLIVALLLCIVAVRQIGFYMKCQGLNNIFQKYSGYAYVQTNYLDLAEQTRPGYEENNMVFREEATIPAINGTFYDVFVANEQAVELLEGILPEIAGVEAEKITIFFPDNMDVNDLEESGRDFMIASAREFSIEADIEYEYYPAGEILAFLSIRSETDNCTVVNDDLTICYSENPIIIYYPKYSENSYYYTEGFVQMSLSEFGNGTDYIDIYRSYTKTVSMYRMQCFMWICISVIFLGLLYLLRIVILKLEHSINAMELCLKKIYGMPLFERYDRMMAGTFMSYAIGMMISVALIYKKSGFNLWLIFIIAFALFAGDMILATVEIYRWETTHVMKILKGGCL